MINANIECQVSVFRLSTLAYTVIFFSLLLLNDPEVAWTQMKEEGSAPSGQVQANADSTIASEEFKPEVVIAQRLPAIRNVAARPFSEADMILRNEELVLGVEINGRSRAYPINMLFGPTREIINDELNGVFIAATW